MKTAVSFGVDIMGYNAIFRDTLKVYRQAADFLIAVCVEHWDEIEAIEGTTRRKTYVEHLVHSTKGNAAAYPSFDRRFYKLPIYMLRSAIAEAIGKAASYRSNLANGTKAGRPKAGNAFPAMYRDGSYIRIGEYEARLKVYRNNTWDWITVSLKKQDVDYLKRRFGDKRPSAPTLEKRGKKWSLRFVFEDRVELPKPKVQDLRILAVDLGINNAATCTVMCRDGTIQGRHFLKLPKETDSLWHAIGRIKKAQQHGNHKAPRLWAKANGINKDISVKTAQFIADTAAYYNVDVIVFEHLEIGGRVSGSKKQKLHMWKSRAVQNIVTDRAHRMGIRIARVNAWNTSRLAYDGSGCVKRGIDGNYSICRFQSGKLYNCDLSASYNIGARYLIRETLKSLSERKRLALEAKVPQAAKRSTCTYSTLISMNAELERLAA